MKEEYDYADNINCIKQLLPAFGQLESVKIKISLDIKKSVLSVQICGQKTQTTDGFYRPQIITDWHRLRAKGSD